MDDHPPGCRTTTTATHALVELGAGDGNRTRVASLEVLYAAEYLFGIALVGGLGSVAFALVKCTLSTAESRLRYRPSPPAVRLRLRDRVGHRRSALKQLVIKLTEPLLSPSGRGVDCRCVRSRR